MYNGQCRGYNYDSMDSGCQTVSIVTGDGGCRHLSPFPPFLTISLCRAGQYFIHPVFLILCHVFSQLVFHHVSLYSCMLPLHLFFGRPLLLLPETSCLSDFTQMWLRSRLKQWPNHFSLLFSKKGSTAFTRTSFLMSSFLMWSNLVPLAHLNILILAEFIFLLYGPTF